MSYEELLPRVLALASSWAAGDMDAHVSLEDPLSPLAPEESADLVKEFCSRAGAHVDEHGADAVGDVIWYLMGSGWQVWHDVVKAPVEHAEQAILSLRGLYARCFATHLGPWPGVGSQESRLGTACYMLWDMDGGLDGILHFERPKALVPACYAVLEHALSLDSPACWESALHGLGHVAARSEGRVGELIDAFLAAKAGRIPEDVLAYAQAARSGCVQ